MITSIHTQHGVLSHFMSASQSEMKCCFQGELYYMVKGGIIIQTGL